MSIKNKLNQIVMYDQLMNLYEKEINWCDKHIERILQMRESYVKHYNENANANDSIMDLVEQLPTIQRNIIFAIYVNRKSVQQISKGMNIPESEVINQHGLAIKTLEELSC